MLGAFDLVVTVVLGSMLATVRLAGDVARAEGVLAMALLQLVVVTRTLSCSRWCAESR